MGLMYTMEEGMSETALSVTTTKFKAARQLSNFTNKVGSRQPTTSRSSFDSDEFMAAAIGDTAWLKQSLHAGRDPTQYDKNGLAAIHLAALHGRLECLKLLVEKYSVNVNLPSSTGWRPLHLAINSRTGKRSLSCVQYLLRQGANASLVNDDDLTPTHQAAIEGSVKCLEALVRDNAAIHLPDNKGHLALDYAKIWGHQKCARILAAEHWRRKMEEKATERDKLKHFRYLKEKDADDCRLAEQFYNRLPFAERFDELEPKPTRPALKQVSKVKVALDKQYQGKGTNELYKPNSLRKPESQTFIREYPSISHGNKQISLGNSSVKQQKKTGQQHKHTNFISTFHSVPDSERTQPHSSPMHSLPKEVIEHLIEEKPSPHERPLNFQCRNIIDVQHRRLFTDDVKNESEMYAHISDNFDSELFPCNSRRFVQSQPSSSQSSYPNGIDTERVSKMMEGLSKPARFPAIEGNDYTYSFEVL